MKKKSNHEIANVIQLHRAKPMVSSLKIAELFGRRHDNVLKSIRKVLIEGRGLLPLEESYLNEQNKRQPLYWLEEREALIVMPFIGGVKAVEGQEKLVDAYLYYRDNFKEPPRKDVLEEKRKLHHPMMEMKKFTYELLDEEFDIKREAPKENYFCNRALTGKWEALDESTLDNYDLKLLAAIRAHNAILIAHFPKQKPERFERMEKFVQEYRAKHPRLTLVKSESHV